MGARARFLDAQDGQMFRPIIEVIEFDIGADLLEPTLGLRFDDAEQVADAYMRALLGAIPPVVLRWGDLIEGSYSA